MSRQLQRLHRRVIMAIACAVLALSIAPAQALQLCPTAAATCVAAASNAGVPAASRLVAVRAGVQPVRQRVHGPSASVADAVPARALDGRRRACNWRRFYSKSPLYLTIRRLSR